MNENSTLRLNRLLLILASGGTVRDDVLRDAERDAHAAASDDAIPHTVDRAGLEAAA